MFCRVVILFVVVFVFVGCLGGMRLVVGFGNGNSVYIFDVDGVGCSYWFYKFVGLLFLVLLVVMLYGGFGSVK